MTPIRRHLTDRFGIGYFIAPAPLLAVAVLILNDHYLKRTHPSFITGKLSDLTGVFFFPIFLCALWNLTFNIGSLVSGRSRFRWINMRQGLIAIAFTDLLFASVKMIPAATHGYLSFLNSLGYPSAVTRDPTDLVALFMNPLTYWYIAYEDYCSSR